MANRTSKGTVTSEARKKHGGAGGSYPIFDHKSCMSAVKLRGHRTGSARASIISRAAAWASKHGDKA